MLVSMYTIKHNLLENKTADAILCWDGVRLAAAEM